MQNDSDIYLLPDIVKGRHVFFAINNTDFSEDTSDDKPTLHSTAMAIYQKTEPHDIQYCSKEMQRKSGDFRPLFLNVFSPQIRRKI